jgi:hypothetical protein
MGGRGCCGAYAGTLKSNAFKLMKSPGMFACSVFVRSRAELIADEVRAKVTRRLSAALAGQASR